MILHKEENTMATPFDNDLKKAVNLLRELVCMSFDKQWNIHSAIGSKYGELFVASELREHEPIIGKKRNELKGVSRPTSSDIVLYETQKKVEVKWGMLHHRDGDYYFDTRGKIPYWGWGFGSKGSQFKNSKFGIQPLEIEKSLLNRSLHKRRWEELKRNGLLKD